MRYKKVLDRIKEDTPQSSIKEREGRLLKDLAESIDAKVIVETGTKYGYSAIWLGSTGAEVHTVDIAHGGKLAQDQKIARENIEESGLDITQHTKDSVEFLKDFDKEIDLLFLDSLHEWEHILAEIKEGLPKVREGGIVVVHDALYATTNNNQPFRGRGMYIFYKCKKMY